MKRYSGRNDRHRGAPPWWAASHPRATMLAVAVAILTAALPAAAHASVSFDDPAPDSSTARLGGAAAAAPSAVANGEPLSCSAEIPIDVSRGDNPEFGGRYSSIRWDGHVFCNFGAGISAATAVVDRTLGFDGNLLGSGPLVEDTGEANSAAQADLYDVDDVDEDKLVAEVLLSLELYSPIGVWAGCFDIPGLRYLRCDGVGTSTLSVVLGTGPRATQKPTYPFGALSKTGGGVALTFDDGPSQYTDQVLDILRDNGVRATFCLVGTEVARFPNQVRRIVAEGHTLCNHTFAHNLGLGRRSEAKIRENLLQTNQAIRSAAPGARIAYFRHPGGAWTRRAVEVARGVGMTSLHWDVDPKDFNLPGTQKIIKRVLDNANSRSIVLMHDGGGDRSQTVEALRTIVPNLKSRFGLIPMP